MAIHLRPKFRGFAGTQYLSTNHGAIPYGEDRLDWEGSLNGTYRSNDLRCELTKRIDQNILVHIRLSLRSYSMRDRALGAAARLGFGLAASEPELPPPRLVTGGSGRVRSHLLFSSQCYLPFSTIITQTCVF